MSDTKLQGRDELRNATYYADLCGSLLYTHLYITVLSHQTHAII